jgi:Rrf2 family protein
MVSKKCKYAIKAVLNIAKNQEGVYSNSAQISSDENIPKKFLESILLELRNAKILRSNRGKNGGYCLNKALNEISFAEIIRVIDGPIALLPCVSLNYHSDCIDCSQDLCPIYNVFSQVRDSSLEILNTSIAKYI